MKTARVRDSRGVVKVRHDARITPPPPAPSWRWAVRVLGSAAALMALAWWASPELVNMLHSAPVATADRGAAFWAHRTSGPFVHGIAHGISIIHSTLGILTLTAILALLLLRLAETRWIPALVAVVPGGLLLNAAIKHAVQRPRPDWGFGAPSLPSFSFPSGHTAGSALFYGILVVLLWGHVKAPWGRVSLLLVAGALVALVASSRIILGVHFLSDCIAAVPEALAWISICLFVGPRDPAWNSQTP